MTMDAHVAELTEKHRKLESLIEEELAHAGHDPLRIGELKREKLRIKDEIERLSCDVETRH